MNVEFFLVRAQRLKGVLHHPTLSMLGWRSLGEDDDGEWNHKNEMSMMQIGSAALSKLVLATSVAHESAHA